jgi:hypothetical protein
MRRLVCWLPKHCMLQSHVVHCPLSPHSTQRLQARYPGYRCHRPGGGWPPNKGSPAAVLRGWYPQGYVRTFACSTLDTLGGQESGLLLYFAPHRTMLLYDEAPAKS